MPKRKAASHNKQNGPNSAKKARTEGTAAAAAAAAVQDATDGGGSSGGALAHAHPTQRIATQTLKLVHAIKKSDGNFVQRMQAVVDLLKEHANRPESLLDLSLVAEGDEVRNSCAWAALLQQAASAKQQHAPSSSHGLRSFLPPPPPMPVLLSLDQSCVIFQLLHFFRQCCRDDADADGVKADKAAARKLINGKVLPLKHKLLRSFDPAAVDAATGNNALHEMCSLFSLESVNGWPYRLCKLFIDRGVSVHARNKQGRTPMLGFASHCDSTDGSACGLRLLLARGADPNALDGEGNGLLHLLVQCKAVDLLFDLFDADGTSLFNFTLCNSAGQSAAVLAAAELAQQAYTSADSPEMRIHRLMATQTAVWTKHVLPALLRCLQVVPQQADAAVANSRDLPHAALARAKLAMRIAVQTLKLVDAIKKTDGSNTQRMQAVADLLKKDANRSESLLNLSLIVEGEKSCVMFQLLDFFQSCYVHAYDAGVTADKLAAQQLIVDQVLPLRQQLLRSFHPTTVDTTTGNNALHKMCTLLSLDNIRGWLRKLIGLLIARGVSVHARDSWGRTPLLLLAASSHEGNSTASGMRLLLRHGADLNAQDNEGNGVLHHLILCDAKGRLKDLLGGSGVAHLDHTLRNKSDQTAADLAAVQLAATQTYSDEDDAYDEEYDQDGEDEEDEEEDEEDEDEEDEEMELWQRARQVQLLVQAHTAKWTERVRPELLRHLESALSVTDLAKLTLGYIDGSGLPFVTAAAQS